MKLWKCPECKAIWKETELLQAPNPFDPKYTILGCPQCKEIPQFVELCDEPDCRQEASCGTPTLNGYRRTCWIHAPK